MASVHDVAAYLVDKFGVLGTMKLEKLAYYSQAWWVARNSVPLFPEHLEAWRMGPVCPELYVCHRRQNFVDSWAWGDVDALTSVEKQHIDAIADVYGAYSGFRLGDMTHQERPWNIAMAKGQNSTIEIEDMRSFFRERDTAGA
ncbi:MULTISPECIES: Panacea domain-containing protein [Tsukamurella]|uniref:DUF4065 domain-containing protein n=2 Tax=Tsukamurella TaxID=2060 RepID=A0A5C5S613_9ACTN|nr:MULTISPECIES: type II toxin-antitoxin system antitoxin SocA domain-containing protein [Tsukamurella]NMD55230.1 DUF4065 domain-containing protein [Tsukamurella columbiensis]TWS30250.1 DUF4065 domain-containing protein [Tsukamurella conjunctivitidis]